jgi:hypothetical protein
MFNPICKFFIKPDMLKYIEERHNRWLINYSNNLVSKSYPGLKVSDLVKEKNEKPIFNNFLIFIGLISFLAGYNFRNLIKRV